MKEIPLKKYALEIDNKILQNHLQDIHNNKIILNGGNKTIFFQDKLESIKIQIIMIMKLI